MPAPLFLLGAPRSGTTLLRVMLAGHPALFSPPEMIIAPFAAMRERKARLDQRFWEKGGLRRAIMELDGVDVDAAKATEASLLDRTVPEVYAWIQARLGERTLVDKCPHLAADPAPLDRLARWFPDARWLWIVRHPGSVTRSIENMPMAEVMLQGYAGDPRDIWHHCNRNVRDFLAKRPGRHARVSYEALVTDPRPTLERMCAELELPFHEALLTPYEGDRMREGPPGARAVGDPNMAGRSRLQPELATSWLEGFDPESVSPETHTLARELGYDLGALAVPPLRHTSAALHDLLGTVARLEREMRVPADLDAVEGRRFLLRMLSASVDLFVEEGDADHPHFHHSEGPTRKMFADNPDADYLRAPIDLRDGRRYRVWGRVPPGTPYLGLLLYRRGGVCGERIQDAAFVAEDGSFDLVVGAGGRLVGAGDETALMVRQYYTDRTRQSPAELHIAPLFPVAPSTVAPGSLTRQLERAKRNLEAVFSRTEQARTMAIGAALNRFIPIGGEALFPTPDNTYQVCWYRIGADQQLVVRGRLPRARYVSFTLYNTWLESLEYRERGVHLNHTQLRHEDGAYELIVACDDPGHPNWLDAAGHLAGYLVVRVLLPEEEPALPAVVVRYAREG